MSGVFVRLGWLTGLKIAIGGALILWSNSTLAQVTPDTTLGAEGSVVTPNVEIKGVVSERVDGGAIRGANLFHSFQEFNVGEGRGVYFSNPQGIENILSRVTGANRSEILGRLGVLGNANLFLINPSGIVFGQNASLDVEGSFVATTAEAIALGEQGNFSATQPQQSSLLSVSPGALFFNQVAAQPGNIIHGGNLSAGKDLTLAANNLDLQGQLVAGGDLNLQATDTVRIRDSVATPFLARSGENLTIVGNQGIDILALNHSMQTPFVSGGNLSLISDGIVSGDARFSSGGSFSILSTSGELANFVSKYDPIISSNGNVDVAANYTGASLLVESKGNIRFRGNINITRPDTSALPAGEDTETLSKSTALIMRSRQNTLAYGGVNSGSVPAFANGDVPEGITLGGNVTLRRSNGSGGLVSLTTASGDVSTRAITTNGGRIDINSAGAITTNGETLNARNGANNGGEISLKATNGNINTGNLNSYSYSASSNVADGGTISLKAANGSITTGNLDSFSDSRSGNAANGGAIAFTALGNITTGDLKSYSYSTSSNADQGGAISLKAMNGSITTGNLDSFSDSRSSNAANGGAIAFTALDNITTGDLKSYSYSTSNNAANGGAITFTTLSNITTGDLKSYSYSRSGNAGNGGVISLKAANGGITSGNLKSSSESRSSNAANGGAITFSALGNITTGNLDSYSYSRFGSAGNGGVINLQANNSKVTIGNLNSSSNSPVDSGGNGGMITFTALGNITTGGMNSEAGGTGNGGDITLISNAGAIDTTIGTITSQIRDNSNGTGRAGVIAFTASGDIQTTLLNASAEKGDGGNIQLTSTNGVIDTTRGNVATNSGSGNGGAIAFTAYNNITTGNIFSNAFHGNGGNIIFKTKSGSINTVAGKLETGSLNNRYDGGAVLISAYGDITTGRVETSSTQSRKGGDITLKSVSGTINTTAGALLAGTNWGQAGNISLIADSNITTSVINSSSQPFTNGLGGNIILTSTMGSINTTAGKLSSITRGGQSGVISLSAKGDIITGDIETFGFSSGGVGNGGNITLSADGSIKTGNILTHSNDGYSGNISLKGNNINLVSALSTGKIGSGNITIKSNEAFALVGNFIYSDTFGSGKGGDIQITAPSVFLTEGSQVSATTHSSGSGGNIAIRASNRVEVSGVAIDSSLPPQIGGSRIQRKIQPQQYISFISTEGSPESSVTRYPSGLYTQADTNSTGNAGNLVIETQQLIVRDRAAISASTSGSGLGGSLIVRAPEAVTLSGNGQLTVETSGMGHAGDVSISTQRLTIQDNAKVLASTTTTSSGEGGNINIRSNSLTLNKGVISARTQGQGNGGNINIDVDRLLSATDSNIITAAQQSSGGAIAITAKNIRLYGDSDITTNVGSGTGGGGDITVIANSIIAFDDSDILTFANGGKGGNISLRTPAFFGQNYRPAPKDTDPLTLNGNNRVDINARGAVSGVITLPDTSFIQNSLSELSENPIDTGSLIANSCIARNRSQQQGSFTITGSGGLPSRPGEALMSQYTFGTARTVSNSLPSAKSPRRPWQKGDPIVEPQGVYQLSSGQMVLSRECL